MSGRSLTNKSTDTVTSICKTGRSHVKENIEASDGLQDRQLKVQRVLIDHMSIDYHFYCLFCIVLDQSNINSSSSQQG